MKLTAIRVCNVGRFAAPVAVERLSGGLDVLTEGNEFGKSTLFRAIEAVFLLKHTVSGAALERLRPYGGGEPLIEADFAVDGRAYRIRKQFGRGKGAELFDLAAGSTLARGAEAEDALVHLVGAGDGKPNRLGLLWVGQQRSLEPSDPDHGKDRGERGALQAAIEREIETVTSGAEAGRVRSRVKELLSPLTGGRQKQPKTDSAFAQAIRERDRIAADLGAARAAEAASAERLSRLERLIGERSGAYSAAALAQSAEKLAAAREEYEQARSARQRLDRATAEFEKAAAADAQHARALADFDAALGALARIDAEIAPALEMRRAAIERHELSERQVAGTVAAADALVRDEAGVRAALAAHAAAERRQAVAERLERASRELAAARSLEADIAACEARLAANPATDERVREIENLSREASRWADLILLQRQASAPRISFSLEPGAEGRVSAGGRVLKSGDEVLAERALEIAVAGIGVITVAPAVSTDAAELAVRQTEADSRLRDALACVGAADVADAARARAARAGDEQARAVARQTLARLAAGGTAALASAVASLTREHAAMAEGSMLPDRGAAEAALADLAQRRAEAENARESARKDADAARRTLDRLDAESDVRARRQAELRAALPPDGARDGERSRLRQLAETAAAAARDALRTVEAMREVAPDERRLADLAAAAAALDDGLARRKRAAHELDLEIGKLEVLIEQAGEDGATTRVKELSGALELAEETVGHFEAEKRGLLELDEALASAEAEIRERFLAPVTQRLGPYLATVFPDAVLKFGDGFKVTELVRDGRGEAFEVLSDGTREQIAVLVRLGFGRLLADGGRPAPLILDDALVYSDDERIGRMFEALAQAAARHQVLVLTCRVGLFATLADRFGGHRVAAERWAAG